MSPILRHWPRVLLWLAAAIVLMPLAFGLGGAVIALLQAEGGAIEAGWAFLAWSYWPALAAVLFAPATLLALLLWPVLACYLPQIERSRLHVGLASLGYAVLWSVLGASVGNWELFLRRAPFMARSSGEIIGEIGQNVLQIGPGVFLMFLLPRLLVPALRPGSFCRRSERAVA